MEQQQVQQLQLQGAVDALKGVIDALVQDKMNLSAQNYVQASQLRELQQKIGEFEKQLTKITPTEATDGSKVA